MGLQLDSERILVIKQSAFGDFILSLGAMEAIRRHHPKASITLLTTKPFQEMAKRMGVFNRIEVMERLKIFDIKGWKHIRKFFLYSDFDRVYDLQMNGQTKKYFSILPKSKRPEWSGVIKSGALFYDNPHWRDMHAFDRHVAVLKLAGIEKIDMPDMTWIEQDIGTFNIQKPFILLVAGSAPTRLKKRWSARKYAELAKIYQEKGYDIVALGTEAERDVIDVMTDIAPNIIDLSGKTNLFDIGALARRASGCVGNDTGPVHLIAASGCPTLTLFSSSSNPAHSAPRGENVHYIQKDDLNDLSVETVCQNIRLRKGDLDNERQTDSK